MKKNILIIILLVITIGLGGYITYDKVTNKPVNNETKVEKKEVKSETDTYGEYIKKIAKRDNIKEVTIEGVDSITRYFLGSDNNVYVESGAEDSVVIPPQKEDEPMSLKGIKTSLTEVVDLFVVSYGNGGFYKLFILKTDGYLYDVNVDDYSITKTDYKNVIKVDQIATSDATSYSIVDINGNILNK